MKARVICGTVDITVKDGVEKKEFTSKELENMEIINGKIGHTCYSEMTFNDRNNSDEKALKRFKNVAIKSGHQSISEHTSISIEFIGIPKILAMILNSLGVYSTSEKSGRYTEMQGSSEVEKELYKKWVNLFENILSKEEYNSINDRDKRTLIRENARYVCSVFSSTSMVYTTNSRQWNNIIGWCEAYNVVGSNIYEKKLYTSIKALGKELKVSGVYVSGLEDKYNRTFNFLGSQVNNPMYSDREQYGDVYKVVYKTSFVALAQLQRHRVLNYIMGYTGVNEYGYYVPEIIKGNESLELEWKNDMKRLMEVGVVSQATLVNVVEYGDIASFLLKCQERICGRAQFEVFKQTVSTMYKLINSGKLSEPVMKYINTYRINEILYMKCKKYNCVEKCRYYKKACDKREY